MSWRANKRENTARLALQAAASVVDVVGGLAAARQIGDPRGWQQLIHLLGCELALSGSRGGGVPHHDGIQLVQHLILRCQLLRPSTPPAIVSPREAMVTCALSCAKGVLACVPASGAQAGGARRIDPRLPFFNLSGVIHRLPFFTASDRFRLPDLTDRS
eukprot:696251-Prorocentrum_minimum.AAC.1